MVAGPRLKLGGSHKISGFPLKIEYGVLNSGATRFNSRALRIEA